MVKGFSVSNETYTLAWNALVERYDKPRKLASSIIDKLLNAPVANSESLAALQTFLSTFDENIAVLETLHIPDLASFLLFSLAARYLPTSSRRLFESENTEEYPSIESVIKFVKYRLHIIENADGQFSGNSPKPTNSKVQGPRRDPKVSFVSATNPAASRCYCWSSAHGLVDCAKFKSFSIDDRFKIV